MTLDLSGHRCNNVRVDVLKNLCSDIILGYNFQKQHKNLIFSLNGTKPDLIVPGATHSHVSVVNNCKANVSKTAVIEPPSVFRNLSKDVRPIATKSRHFNKYDRAFIAEQISALLQGGLIRRSYSPWRAQIVMVKGEHQKKRMCIDYSQTINLFTELDAYPLPPIEDMVNELSQYRVFSTYDLNSAYHQIPLKELERKYTAFEGLGSLYEFCVLPFGVPNGVPCFQQTMDNIVKEEVLLVTFPYMDNVIIAGVDQEDHDKSDIPFRNMIKRQNITFNESKFITSVPMINILGYRVGYSSIQPDPERLCPLQEFPPPSNPTSLRRALGIFAYYAKWIPQFSDKIRPLAECVSFPLSKSALASFCSLTEELSKVTLSAINEDVPFVIECDVSDVAISASLNQHGRPVAFMSKRLSMNECGYPAVEKETLAIIEAVWKWSNLLSRQPFTLVICFVYVRQS